jgi:hypothetical protein
MPPIGGVTGMVFPARSGSTAREPDVQFVVHRQHQSGGRLQGDLAWVGQPDVNLRPGDTKAPGQIGLGEPSHRLAFLEPIAHGDPDPSLEAIDRGLLGGLIQGHGASRSFHGLKKDGFSTVTI